MTILLCACGCGGQVPLARYPSWQHKFLHGHNRANLDPAAIERRFWSRVHKGDGEACWEWQGSERGPWGHGRFNVGKVRTFAHRYSWQLVNGPIPEGLNVLHRCDNGACVRPAHLFLGTQAENMRDMDAKGRRALGVRHGRAKITADIASAIRIALASGEKPVLVARRYGLARTTVVDIQRGHTWVERVA